MTKLKQIEDLLIENDMYFYTERLNTTTKISLEQGFILVKSSGIELTNVKSHLVSLLHHQIE